MNDNSWIKLFRKFKEWEWYQNSNVKNVFLEILLTANFEDRRWQGIEIKRGQLITSVSSLFYALNKNPKKPDISTHQIRTALDKLKMTNELAIETSSNYTLITINKYNDYQQVANETANEWQTNGKRVATTKEYKNIRIKEIDIMSGKYLSKWNEVFKTTYSSTKQIEKPLTEWLKSYSIEDICKSIENIKNDPYWRDKDVEPLWLLRFRDKTGDVDRIGKFLNTKPELKLLTHLI